MSESAPAVFLSYAREDTDAARRVADALRGFGIEVWFDQSELRGGDQWDGDRLIGHGRKHPQFGKYRHRLVDDRMYAAKRARREHLIVLPS